MAVPKLREILIASAICITVPLLLWQVVPRRIRVTQAEPKSAAHKVLEAAYGKPLYSMGPEELILRDLFQDKRDGVFVDVGAADARILSNNYFLESERGWSGIAVDAQTEYAPGYATFRPRTKFRPFFVSNRSDVQLPFYVAGQRESSSATRTWADKYSGGEIEAITVSTITLDDLLAREGITSFDLLSMDIEKHEPQALAGFSLEKYRPQVVCIEAQGSTRQAILDYFTRHRYVLQAKYLEADPFNFYFVPLN